ncbi:SecY subunit domain-containing protein [Suillus lakei]|nr:SecY subunit domain-containing protein [Suillus lakei]
MIAARCVRPSTEGSKSAFIGHGYATVYALKVDGQPSDLSAGVCLLLIIQLVAAALIVILLDELLQKCYGLGSGISHFIATNSSANPSSGRPSHLQLLTPAMTLSLKGRTLREAFCCDRLPNIMNLLATVIVFAAVIYMQGFRIEILVKSNRFRGQRGSCPVKLFCTSNMPIMLQSALVLDVLSVSQMLATRFPSNILVKILGVWEKTPQLRAVAGIAYYMSPLTIKEAFLDPIHTFLYITFVVSACALFSKTWIEVSGSGPREIAKQLKDQQMVIAGHREGSM